MNRIISLLILALSPSLVLGQTVVVVGKNSPLSKLENQQVANIFLARTNRYPSGAKAIPLELKNDETRNAFYEKVAGKSPNQLNAYWTTLVFTGKGKPPKSFNDVKKLIELLSTNPSAISYLDSSLLTPELKVVFRFNE